MEIDLPEDAEVIFVKEETCACNCEEVIDLTEEDEEEEDEEEKCSCGCEEEEEPLPPHDLATLVAYKTAHSELTRVRREIAELHAQMKANFEEGVHLSPLKADILTLCLSHYKTLQHHELKCTETFVAAYWQLFKTDSGPSAPASTARLMAALKTTCAEFYRL